MPIPYDDHNIPRAKLLRKRMTPQERHLWYDYLAAYPHRFQRQKPIGFYIADFYCHAAKLVVELDGSAHDSESAQAHDQRRTESLQAMGLFVTRFTNHDVDRAFEGVCAQIDRIVNERIAIMQGQG